MPNNLNRVTRGPTGAVTSELTNFTCNNVFKPKQRHITHHRGTKYIGKSNGGKQMSMGIKDRIKSEHMKDQTHRSQ